MKRPNLLNLEEQTIRCLYTNCLSIQNKMAEIRAAVCDTHSDIIALTETWLSPEILDSEVAIPNFLSHRSDSIRGRSGGTIVYTHHSLPPPIMLNTFPSVHNYDTTWLKVHLRSEDTLLFGVVYRSPSSKMEDDSVFISTIPRFICSQKCTHLLLVGDFNAPQAEWVPGSNESTGFSYSLSQLIRDESWFQHVKQPTRFRCGQKPSLLDLVITNEKHFIDNIDIKAPFGKSDHATLEFEFICY